MIQSKICSKCGEDVAEIDARQSRTEYSLLIEGRGKFRAAKVPGEFDMNGMY